PPVAAAGETFVFRGEPALEPLEPDPLKFAIDKATSEAMAAGGPVEEIGVEVPEEHASVFWTLLDEAERRELVEHDDAGALELVLEAVGKGAEEWERPAGRLRALQLGARLGRADVVREQWEPLRETPLGLGPASRSGRVPYRL